MKNMTDNFMISFLQRFDEHPFDVKIHGKTHHIGSGNPAFVVDLKEDIEGKELLWRWSPLIFILNFLLLRVILPWRSGVN